MQVIILKHESTLYSPQCHAPTIGPLGSHQHRRPYFPGAPGDSTFLSAFHCAWSASPEMDTYDSIGDAPQRVTSIRTSMAMSLALAVIENDAALRNSTALAETKGRFPAGLSTTSFFGCAWATAHAMALMSILGTAVLARSA